MKEFQKIGVIVAMEVEMEKIREAMDHVRKRSVSGMDAGPFSPLSIDMRDLPGGVYTLQVGETVLTVVKI